VVAVIGLVLTLYFGYWLSKCITQPIERLARGLDAVTAGDLNRRFADQGPTSAIAEIAASLNQLTDRLQRSESTPRSDLLLACAALERLLDADARPCGVLAGGNRLVASNEEARKLVLARASPFHGLAAEAREKDASAVETLPLEGPGGQSLGDLVRIGRGSKLDV
jgi:HAMP domain-containing protein